MRINTALAGAALLIGTLAGPAAAQEPPARSLKLAFHTDGTVSLSAANVTIREILSEWARQCGCYIVNWDKLTGGPMAVPVQYERMPQSRVLESLLRQAAGYVLTPKRAGSTTVSNYETIYILATSSPTAGAYVAPPPTTAPMMPMPTPGSPEDEIPSVFNPQPIQAPTGPPRPGMPTPMLGPAGTPGPKLPGTPSIFVPIVPIGSAPSNNTPTSTVTVPGMPSPVPQTPGVPMSVPIVPAPPQGR